MDGTTLDLREVAPRTVSRWAMDDMAITAASASTVALDLNDTVGVRGYGLGLDWPTDRAVLLGQLPSAKADRERALHGKSFRINDALVPWFEPLQMWVRSAKRKGGELGAGIKSIIAMGEGGWWTQLRRCAEGLADHQY